MQVVNTTKTSSLIYIAGHVKVDSASRVSQKANFARNTSHASLVSQESLALHSSQCDTGSNVLWPARELVDFHKTLARHKWLSLLNSRVTPMRDSRFFVKFHVSGTVEYECSQNDKMLINNRKFPCTVIAIKYVSSLALFIWTHYAGSLYLLISCYICVFG